MSFLLKNKSAIRTTASSHASVKHLEGIGFPVHNWTEDNWISSPQLIPKTTPSWAASRLGIATGYCQACLPNFLITWPFIFS